MPGFLMAVMGGGYGRGGGICQKGVGPFCVVWRDLMHRGRLRNFKEETSHALWAGFIRSSVVSFALICFARLLFLLSGRVGAGEREDGTMPRRNELRVVGWVYCSASLFVFFVF